MDRYLTTHYQLWFVGPGIIPLTCLFFCLNLKYTLIFQHVNFSLNFLDQCGLISSDVLWCVSRTATCDWTWAMHYILWIMWYYNLKIKIAEINCPGLRKQTIMKFKCYVLPILNDVAIVTWLWLVVSKYQINRLSGGGGSLWLFIIYICFIVF